MCYCIQSRITKLVLRHSVQSKGVVCTISLNKYVKTMSLHWLHQTQKSLPTQKKLNKILKTVHLDNKTGHLFVFDIKFHKTRAKGKTSTI